MSNAPTRFNDAASLLTRMAYFLRRCSDAARTCFNDAASLLTRMVECNGLRATELRSFNDAASLLTRMVAEVVPALCVDGGLQ